MQNRLIFFSVFIFHIFSLLHANSSRIVPYCVERHGKMLALCAQQSYQDLFSNASTDPRFAKPIQQYLYGAAQAVHLGKLCNHFGQIINQDDSITTVCVLEKNDIPAGYVKFTAPYLHKNIGKIDQLAILNKFKGQSLGNILVTHALENFYIRDGINYCLILTTTQEVGEKFYKKKFDFSLIGTERSSVVNDQTLYAWGRDIK